jgi:hypothetical protein
MVFAGRSELRLRDVIGAAQNGSARAVNQGKEERIDEHQEE